MKRNTTRKKTKKPREPELCKFCEYKDQEIAFLRRAIGKYCKELGKVLSREDIDRETDFI